MTLRAAYWISLLSICLLSPYILSLYTRMSSPAISLPDFKKPNGVGDKFDPDGTVLPFQGNTIQSPLPESSKLYASLLVLYERLKKSRLAKHYALLPPSSWHMTVFEGVTPREKKPGYWPDDLGQNASIADCTALFLEKLGSFDLATELPFHMTVVGYTKAGLGLHVVPHERDVAQIRDLRDRLSSLLHIRHADHDRYGLHISLAYVMKAMDDGQRAELHGILTDHFSRMPKEFELGAPEFSTFEDMYAFKPILTLKNLGKSTSE